MSDEKKFKVGDIVALNSGGPKMTVFSYNENAVNCTYQTELNQYFPQNVQFPEACLTIVKEIKQ